LGAEGAKQDQKRADYNTAVGKHIAVPTVKRIRAPDLHRPFDGLFREDRRRLDNTSERIDETGNAGVGCASKGQMILDRTKHHYRQMLRGCRRVTKPCI